MSIFQILITLQYKQYYQYRIKIKVVLHVALTIAEHAKKLDVTTTNVMALQKRVFFTRFTKKKK